MSVTFLVRDMPLDGMSHIGHHDHDDVILRVLSKSVEGGLLNGVGLRCIEQYAETYFNCEQIKGIIDEIAMLLEVFPEDPERAALSALLGLCHEVQKVPTQFLVCLGD